MFTDLAAHMPRARARALAVLGLMALFALLAALLPTAWAATPVDAGYRDFTFPNTVSEPTAEKPESKLWYNDGYWWASMYKYVGPGSSNNGYYIYRLNTTTQDWTATATKLDDRDTSSADVLWDGTKLYVASHIQDNDAQPGQTAVGKEKRLYRYSYTAATDTYTLDSGFPVTIAPNSSETLVIDKDSAGRLWATWVESPQTGTDTSGNPIFGPAQVKLAYSTDGGSTWTVKTLAELGVTSGADNLDKDDIATLVSYQGRIGVMWSNQADKKFFFAVHADGSAPDTGWSSFTVFRDTVSSGDAADDHINLKVQEGPGGQLYAVIKTNFGTGRPDIVLLACRSGTCTSASNWSAFTVYNGTTSTQEHTRPVLLIDTTSGAEKLHIFTTQPTATSEGSQAIYRKSVALAALSDANALLNAQAFPFIKSASDPQINNATTTKQSVNATTGLVVLASDDSTKWYLHGYLSLAPDTTPPATPTATPRGGTYSGALSVQLTTDDPTAVIYYTTDGSTPTPASTRYTGPITIAATTTLKFIAVDEAGNSSGVGTETYTITSPSPSSSKNYLPLIINSTSN